MEPSIGAHFAMCTRNCDDARTGFFGGLRGCIIVTLFGVSLSANLLVARASACSVGTVENSSPLCLQCSPSRCGARTPACRVHTVENTSPLCLQCSPSRCGASTLACRVHTHVNAWAFVFI